MDGDFCHLLITFANSLDPDQDGQNIGPDLYPFYTGIVPERIFFEKVLYDKSQMTTEA